MAEYKVHRCSADRRKTHRYETTAPNEYPTGSVPKETGAYAYDTSVSRIPNHNRITVCRPKKG